MPFFQRLVEEKRDGIEYNMIMVEYIMMRYMHQSKEAIDKMDMDEVLALVKMFQEMRENEIKSMMIG